ncbi:MAG: hypothetical protein HY465_02915 [Deltaproteobacteria bacterium]|nr:hypothetical protein [Deltaproteobacteria bacterium]
MAMGISCLPVTAAVVDADKDQSGCIDPGEADQLRAPTLLEWLTHPSIDPEEARRFVQQLHASSLPTYYRLYVYAHRSGQSKFLFSSDMPPLSWEPPAAAVDDTSRQYYCPVHLMTPKREPVEQLTMGAAALYRDAVRGTVGDVATQVAPEHSFFNPSSDRLVILYGEGHHFPALIHGVADALAKRIRQYGIGFVAGEVMSGIPRSCLPQVLELEADQLSGMPAGSYDTLQLMFPDLDFFGVDSERVHQEHIDRVAAEYRPLVNAVRTMYENGEIDLEMRNRKIQRLLFQAWEQAAIEGVDDRSRASAALLLRAMQERNAHVIVYATGALHIPVLAEELSRSGKTSVLTLVPRGMKIHPDRVEYQSPPKKDR